MNTKTDANDSTEPRSRGASGGIPQIPARLIVWHVRSPRDRDHAPDTENPAAVRGDQRAVCLHAACHTQQSEERCAEEGNSAHGLLLDTARIADRRRRRPGGQDPVCTRATVA